MNPGEMVKFFNSRNITDTTKSLTQLKYN